MKTSTKYFLLYSVTALLLIAIWLVGQSIEKKEISEQQYNLLIEARTHFQDQINTRKWNAHYGGVYVKPKDGMKPNPYLKNGTLKVDDNLTLIKINPAWMTRQLSEMSSNQNFSFRITSLKPINPGNKPDPFEEKALKQMEKNHLNEYFGFEGHRFRYVGALVTTKSCLQCHAHQGYKVGDIRGGISISLKAQNYYDTLLFIQEHIDSFRFVTAALLIIVVILMHKQIRNAQQLKKQIKKAVSEIEINKKILQELVNTDRSFLLVYQNEKLILANQAVLDFFHVQSLEELQNQNFSIAKHFSAEENKNYLQEFQDGVHWKQYLSEKPDNKARVMIVYNNAKHYFEILLKTVRLHEQIDIIVMDEITHHLKKIQKAKADANKDQLTGLYNRKIFDEKMQIEIAYALQNNSSLSLLFVDIDHFKDVNDTYGHDVGDEVLKALAHILRANIRSSDFIARWGGEEFIIILPATSLQQATSLAEKIRQKVAEYPFKTVGHQSISIGLAEYIKEESAEEFVKRADEALYRAKNSGRNKVVAAEEK